MTAQLLEALGDKLVTASVGTLATNLFLGYMPESPDVCVALFEYGGPAPMETMKDMSETIDIPSVQVMVRAARGDYAAGRSKIADVESTLTGIVNETISGVRFLRVHNRGSVNSIGRDADERPMFTLALEALVERS